MKKKLLIVISILGLIFGLIPMAYAEEISPFNFEAADQVYAFDLKTGKVLVNQNAGQEHAIASLTKIISMYMIRDAIEKGEMTWDEQIEISEDIANLSTEPGLSNVPLDTKRTYRVDDLYRAAWLLSANAATMALAIHHSGSENAFVKAIMTQLQEWGIEDAKLYTSSGLAVEYVPFVDYGQEDGSENSMSAESLGKVIYKVLNQYPDILDITKHESLSFPMKGEQEANLINTNYLVHENSDHYYPGVDGLKTGTTKKAGRSTVVTKPSEDGDHHYVAVILGTNSEEERLKTARQVLSYLDNQAGNHTLIQTGVLVSELQAQVIFGTQEQVSLQYAEDYIAYGIFEQENYSLRLNDNQKLRTQAPVSQGEEIGAIELTYIDHLGYIEEKNKKENLTIKVIASESIDRLSIGQIISNQLQEWFDIWMEKVQSFFSYQKVEG